MPNLNQDKLYTTIGARVKALRNQAELSQDQLADRLGLLRTSVSNIESGKKRLTIARLYRLSAALGSDLSEILPPVKDFIDSDIFHPIDVDNLPEKADLIMKKLRREM